MRTCFYVSALNPAASTSDMPALNPAASTSDMQMALNLSSPWIATHAWAFKPTDPKVKVRRVVVINRSWWSSGYVGITLSGTYRCVHGGAVPKSEAAMYDAFVLCSVNVGGALGLCASYLSLNYVIHSGQLSSCAYLTCSSATL